MASEWDEVKRLAADFQRAQLSSTIQKLSERNCIEIVKKCVELGLIEVIFTSDGKEYLTPEHLLKEIQDELYIHGGRINMVDLAQIINVDYSIIESKACEYSKGESDVHIVLGQLITDDYLDHLAEEVNEKLQRLGQTTIGELTKTYDLPGDFLEEVVRKRLGTIIDAEPDAGDPRTLFTVAYLDEHKALIRGILSAVTRPVLLSNLINQYKIPEVLVHSVCEELIAVGRLAGSLQGRGSKSLYIPEIYATAQSEWVDTFYKQNSYLEFDALTRLGISVPKSYIRKRFKDENLLFLQSCCVGRSVVSLLESAVDEVVSAESCVDLKPLLPSVLSVEDCRQLIRLTSGSNPKLKDEIQVFAEFHLVSNALLDTCMNSFQTRMAEKAREDVAKNPHLFLPPELMERQSARMKDEAKEKQQRRKEEVEEEDDEDPKKKKGDGKKKTSKSKSQGGTQGREIKVRATKKKHQHHQVKGRDEEEEVAKPERGALRFLDVEAIEEHLRAQVPDLRECGVVSEIAERLHSPLSRKYEAVARAAYEASVASSASDRRRRYVDCSRELAELLANVCLFEKSLAFFSGEVCTQLSKYLLKTLCSDVANRIVNVATQDTGLAETDEEGSSGVMSAEARMKLIQKLPDHSKQPLQKLHDSLNSKTLEKFWESLDKLSELDMCPGFSRKLDKKKERSLLLDHKQSLLAQLTEANEPALCLHLAVLLVFQQQTQGALHASGKFVPHLVHFLGEKKVPFFGELVTYQGLVVKQLSASEDKEEGVVELLAEMTPKIKELASSFRRAASEEDKD